MVEDIDIAIANIEEDFMVPKIVIEVATRII